MRGLKKMACFPSSGQSWGPLIATANTITGKLRVGSAGRLIGVVCSVELRHEHLFQARGS
jgi:hypothetical protein